MSASPLRHPQHSVLSVPHTIRRRAALAIGVASLAAIMMACGGEDPASLQRAPGGYANSAATTDPAPSASTTASTSASAAPTSPPAVAGVDAGATGDASADASADVSQPVDAAPPSELAVESLSLLDTAVTNVVEGSPVLGYDPILAGATISLATVGTQLSMRANVGGLPVGSVDFLYDGVEHTENAAPFTLCGDNGAGVVTNCNLVAGAHTVVATAYSGPNRVGVVGKSFTLHLTLTP